MSKVFISFDYNDIESKKTVDNWDKQGLGTDVSLISVDGNSHSAKGDEVVRKILRDHINTVDVVLVLVGNSTHNRPWVDYEVHHAKCQSIKVIWTQLPNTNGAPPTEIRKQTPIPFSLKEIQKAIRNV